jgi:signal transduction histidine kinase
MLSLYLRFWTEVDLEKRAFAAVRRNCTDAASEIQTMLEDVTGDVLFLGGSPGVLSLASAMESGDGDEMERWRTHVEGVFLAFAQGRRIYDQVRFLDSAGMEVVRVDYERRRAQVAPRERLQNKNHRYYVTEILKRPLGEVYVSPLDLNREHGEIERPPRPVIRYGTPVHRASRVAGAIVLNVSADAFLRQIRRPVDPSRRDLLVDQSGYYLAHYDRRKEFGGPGDRATGHSLARDYGDISTRFLAGGGGQLEMGTQVVGHRRFIPNPDDPDTHWIVLSIVPRELMLGPVADFRAVLGVVFTASLLVAVWLSIVLSRRLSDPLRRLERGAERLGRGELEHRVEIDTGDEMGTVANAFNEMARRLREARDQERLALVGRMSAGIVHDIRNPLTSIKGFADLLATTEDPGERREFSRIVSEDTDRVLSMIRELLDFSRGRPTDLRMEPVRIDDFLARVERDLRRDMEHAGVEVNVSAGEGADATVEMDSSRMLRVMINLAANAREAMTADGGTLSVEAGRSDGTVTISVQDTGPGIPDEVADALFDPFVTHGKEHGTGLGLAICQQIVAAHGGTLTLDRRAESGSRFVIALPASQSEETSAAG